ncbi:MAG: hypothetical protein JO202_18335 [Ktedonobacteraceae bacterium]|nr:hypothetical protein [Ktedonobacteraceae bacterium]
MLHPEANVPPLRLNEVLGGLVHPAIDLAAGACVLDVGREVGNWTQELAASYPQQHLVRVEMGTPAVSAGRQRKEWAEVTSTWVPDVLQLEDRFAPASFDVISVHFCAAEVLLQHFPVLMHALLHLCKEQGHLVWLETDLPITCDDAYERLAWLLIGAMRARGDRVACLCVPQVGIGAWMECWLHDAGWKIIDTICSRATISAGVPLHDLFVQQVQHFAPHLYSFLLGMQVATPQVLDDLFAQVQQEMRHKDFFGFCPLSRFVCMKPPLWQSRRWWGKG